MGKIHLVIGGARSGKSLYAEKILSAWEPPYLYVATAEVLDEEMAARVAHHRARRGERWMTCEEPLALVEVLDAAPERRPVLVDCLTLWISNLLLAGRNVPEEVERLRRRLAVTRPAPVVLVSNEVGLGIVPENALARRFRDLAGWANQMIAEAASHVTWMVAGIPVVIKANGALTRFSVSHDR